MERLQSLIGYLEKMDIKLKVKINGRKLPFLFVLAIFLLGVKTCIDVLRKYVIVTLWRLLQKGWKGGLGSLTLIGGITSTTTDQSSAIVENWPSMKQLFRKAFRNKVRLLDMKAYKQNLKKNIIIYGACSHMGQIAASLMLKYGYSLILVDQNLEKLQRLKLTLLRKFIDQFQHCENAQNQMEEQNKRIQLLQLDLCVYRDSTTLEKYFRQVIDIADDDLDMPIIVNTSGYGGYWQVCEDKLYHELQFDQLMYYQSQVNLGFGLIMLFFTRKVFHHKTNALILNIQKKPIHPAARRPMALKILRWVLRPDLFPDVLERVNIPHFAQHYWLEELTQKMRISYPMISYYNVHVDHRIDKVYEPHELENDLKNCLY